jgi:prepilin-type N-terminal cleavage/methylation domain-containing protein
MYEDGFTLVETLVAIAIMSIIGVSVFLSFRGGLSSADSTRSLITNSTLALKLDDGYRESLSSSSVPYWISAEDAAPGIAGRLREGKAGGYIVSTEYIRDSDGKIRGVSVVYSVGKTLFRTDGLFSSTAIIGGRKK